MHFTVPCSVSPNFKPQLTSHLLQEALLGAPHPPQTPFCPAQVTQPCNYLFPGPSACTTANSAPAHTGSSSVFEEQHDEGLRPMESVYWFQITVWPLTSRVTLGGLRHCSVPRFPLRDMRSLNNCWRAVSTQSMLAFSICSTHTCVSKAHSLPITPPKDWARLNTKPPPPIGTTNTKKKKETRE